MKIALQFVLPLACLCGVVLAQPRPAAGTFDYYVFSLSWTPEYCAQPGVAQSHPQECAAGRAGNFVVHGLWPELAVGPSPESCGPAKSVPHGIVNQLMPAMPSEALIQHEWATHGTCSGVPLAGYFTNVLLARSAVQIPVQLTSLTEREKDAPGQIEDEFVASNAGFPKETFRVVCRGGALTEVRVCLTKELKARACTANAGRCDDAVITVRPPAR